LLKGQPTCQVSHSSGAHMVHERERRDLTDFLEPLGPTYQGNISPWKRLRCNKFFNQTKKNEGPLCSVRLPSRTKHTLCEREHRWVLHTATKVLSSAKTSLLLQLVASEFSAHLQSSNGHQVRTTVTAHALSFLEHLQLVFYLYIFRWYDWKWTSSNRHFIWFFITVAISIFSYSFSTSRETIKNPLLE
jgi:hypothetical protein